MVFICINMFLFLLPNLVGTHTSGKKDRVCESGRVTEYQAITKPCRCILVFGTSRHPRPAGLSPRRIDLDRRQVLSQLPAGMCDKHILAP
jgi:hypothetical protein